MILVTHIVLTLDSWSQIVINCLNGISFGRCDVTFWNGSSVAPRDEFLRNIVGKSGIFVTLNDRIDAEVLDQAGPNLKVIGTMSVG